MNACVLLMASPWKGHRRAKMCPWGDPDADWRAIQPGVESRPAGAPFVSEASVELVGLEGHSSVL